MSNVKRLSRVPSRTLQPFATAKNSPHPRRKMGFAAAFPHLRLAPDAQID